MFSIFKFFAGTFLALLGIAVLLLFDVNLTAIIIAAIIAIVIITVTKILKGG